MKLLFTKAAIGMYGERYVKALRNAIAEFGEDQYRVAGRLSDGNLPAFQNGTTAAMVAGVSAVIPCFVDRTTVIIAQCNTAGGTQGAMRVATADLVFTAVGVVGSFVARSSNALDTSTLDWIAFSALPGMV